VIQRDIENLASKQIFAGWQAQFSLFDFTVEHIKGESNSIPDFLTREFLQEGKLSSTRVVNMLPSSSATPYSFWNSGRETVVDRVPSTPDIQALFQSCKNTSAGTSILCPARVKDDLLGSDFFGNENSKFNWQEAERILVGSESVFIRAYKDKSGRRTHSVCVINKIENLGALTMSEQHTVGSITCSYLDYREAFHELFRFENATRTHSWFILLGRTFNFWARPNWFDDSWWIKFGIVTEAMPVEAAMEAVGTKSYDGLREATPNDLITYIAVKQQPWILKWEYRLMFSHKGAATLVRDFKVRWHFPKDEDLYYIKGGVPLSEEAKAQGWREIRKPVEIVGCLDCYSTEPDPEPEEEDFDLTLPLNQEACRTLTGKGKELSHGSPSSSKTPFWEARSPTQQREMRVGSAFSGLRIKTDSPQKSSVERGHMRKPSPHAFGIHFNGS